MFLLLAGTSALAALLSLLLPETKGRRLPEQLNELPESSSSTRTRTHSPRSADPAPS